jgi:hypothetical protein
MKLIKLVSFTIAALFAITASAKTHDMPNDHPYVGFAFTQGGLVLPTMDGQINIFG